MKLRHIVFATAALFAIGPVVSHADDGTRLVSITLARIQALLGSGSTAATNLGFGTASLANTGTSGATVPLLNGTNTFSADTNFSNHLLLAGTDFAINSGGFNILYDSTGTNTDILLGSGVNYYSNTSHVFRSIGGSSTFATIDAAGLHLPKLSAAPGSPGAGLTSIFLVAGTTAGTAKLQILAGTSTTPSTILDNIGAGF